MRQLDSDAHAYHATAARRLLGVVDITVLRKAFGTIVARHEALRTGIETVDGVPVQVVHENVAFPVPLLDAPGLSEPEQTALLRDLVREPFDLATPPLLRAVVVRMTPREHLLLVVADHLIWDGWSKGILFRELNELYRAGVADRVPVLPAPTLQYADYAVWQRQPAREQENRRQLGYWREQLAGAPPLLDLPTDHPRPAVQGHHGARVSLRVDARTTTALRGYAGRERATLFMVLVAGWVALLHRHSAASDITVGTPIAGRNAVELEDVIGYFTNTLALRVDCAGDPTFTTLLARVRETALGAYAHQDVPLEQVLRAVVPRRDLSYSPIFQTMIVLQNSAGEQLRLPGITVEMLTNEPGTAKFDLSLAAGEFDGELRASLEYRTDLFARATADRLADQLVRLLESVAEEPARPLSAIPLLSAADQAELLAAGRGPSVPVAAPTLHAMVAARAAQCPDAPAVVGDEETLTYRELGRRSAVLCRALRQAGVHPGTAVGLFAHRGPDTVVAMLAVLAAGGACVPLDPDYPDERLGYLVADARPALIVTDRALRRRAGTFGVPAAAVADLTDPDATDEADLKSVSPPTGPDDVAFILYTSGSTGEPKGVELEHRGLVNHALAASRGYRIGRADRVLQFASLSFDISIEETFCTLVRGAALVLRTPEMPLAGPGFVTWLAARRVTVLDLPTAFWHAWVHDLTRHALRPPASLRLVVVGGEQASAAALAAWRALADPAVRWVNTYGPTEASVVATWYEPPDDWHHQPGREIPIGHPLENVTVHLLDARRNPVPPGARGEIYLAGAGLARGYRGRAAATAERFVTLPGGQRAYRTGDLARRAPGGPIEFAGRADRQIKLRGFRIEPAEVEAVLAGDPRVDAALAVLRTEREPALVGYVATRAADDPRLVPDLRRLLAASVPHYAIPAAVLAVREFPLTSNGKVDLAALPAPVAGPAGTGHRAPRDGLESVIADTWADLLGHPVGLDDDFFDLGGHSMHAAQLFARLEQHLHIRLPVATLMRAPTVAALAQAVRRGNRDRDRETVVELKPGSATAPLVLVHDLGGELLCYRDLVRHLREDRMVIGLQATGPTADTDAETDLAALARRYVDALGAARSQPCLLAGWSFGGVLAYEMARQLDQAGTPAAFVGLIDAVPVRPTAAPDPTTTDAVEVNVDALRRYEFPRYPGRITLLRAVGDTHPPPNDRRLRWRALAGHTDVRDITSAGVGHRTVLAEPHVRELARALDAAADEALGAPR